MAISSTIYGANNSTFLKNDPWNKDTSITKKKSRPQGAAITRIILQNEDGQRSN